MEKVREWDMREKTKGQSCSAVKSCRPSSRKKKEEKKKSSQSCASVHFCKIKEVVLNCTLFKALL